MGSERRQMYCPHGRPIAHRFSTHVHLREHSSMCARNRTSTRGAKGTLQRSFGEGNSTGRAMILLMSFRRYSAQDRVAKETAPNAAAVATTAVGAPNAIAPSAKNAPSKPELTKVTNMPLLARTFERKLGPTRWLYVCQMPAESSCGEVTR